MPASEYVSVNVSLSQTELLRLVEGLELLADSRSKRGQTVGRDAARALAIRLIGEYQFAQTVANDPYVSA